LADILLAVGKGLSLVSCFEAKPGIVCPKKKDKLIDKVQTINNEGVHKP